MVYLYAFVNAYVLAVFALRRGPGGENDIYDEVGNASRATRLAVDSSQGCLGLSW